MSKINLNKKIRLSRVSSVENELDDFDFEFVKLTFPNIAMLGNAVVAIAASTSLHMEVYSTSIRLLAKEVRLSYNRDGWFIQEV